MSSLKGIRRKLQPYRVAVGALILVVALVAVVALVVPGMLYRAHKHITLDAECGIIMGNLYNKINTPEDCQVQCRNQCFSVELELSASALVQNETTKCNSCECDCR